MSTSGDRVQVAFAQEHVVDALQFDGATIFGFEQHGIAHFDAADVRSDGDNLRPTQPATDLSRRGNDDASTGTTFTVLATFTNEYAIVQEFDGDGTVGSWAGVGCDTRVVVGSGQRRRRLRTLIAT